MINTILLLFKINMLIIISSLSFVSNGFSEISVYDANDQYLGVIFGDGGYVGEEISVFIPQLGLPVRFSAQGDIKPLRTYSPIRFESDDCTGIPYRSLDKATYQYIYKHGCDIYYHVSDKHKSFVYKSYYYDQCECIKETGTYIGDYIELSVFQEENFPFILPITIPVYFKYNAGGDINGDGKIGLKEAINALQVTTGMK